MTAKMMTKENPSAIAVALTMLIASPLLGCSSPSETGSNGPRNFAQKTDNGLWQFYSGSGVASAIPEGRVPPGPYARITVPDALVAQAAASPNRVVTLSLEKAQPFDIEIMDVSFDHDTPAGLPEGSTAPLKAYYLRPGDPWLTGYVQVFFPDEDVPENNISTNVPVGAFSYVQYSKNVWPDGHASYSSHKRHGSLKNDPNVPELEFANLLATPPENWPELPPHWE